MKARIGVFATIAFLAVTLRADAMPLPPGPVDPDPVATTELWYAAHVFTAVRFSQVTATVRGSVAYVEANNYHASAGAYLVRFHGVWRVMSSERGRFSREIFTREGVSAANASAAVNGGCPPLTLRAEEMTADQRRFAANSSRAVAGARTAAALAGQMPKSYRLAAVPYRVCRI